MAAPARRLDTQFKLLLPEALPQRPILVPPPPLLQPGEREDVTRLRASLEAHIAARVMNASELVRSLANRRRDELLPTTIALFDELLGGGLARGKTTELAGRRSAGRFSIVLSALAAATSAGEAAVLIDLADNFDPQIAEANGVDLRRLLWIRPHTLRQAVMSAEVLTATGFQLVVLDAGSHPIRGRRVPAASWVRLARSAEAHGTAMLISTPYPLTGTTSEAVVAARSVRAKWLGSGKSPRVLAGTQVDVTLEKHRHIRPGKSATLMFRCVDACAEPAATDASSGHERAPRSVVSTQKQSPEPAGRDGRRLAGGTPALRR